MAKEINVSVIIPVKEINNHIRKGVSEILKQSYKDFEIIVLPNESGKEKFTKTRVIPTGAKGPAEKRDLGVRATRGKIIALIDDDAYPTGEWLSQAVEDFKDKDVAIVGGPNLTPPESNFFQKLSGEVLQSPFVSGPVAYRYKEKKIRESDDLPSCNLFIRKNVFLQVGGFDTSFWPGEDTKLCLDVKKLGKRIIYDPRVKVYHHRRENLSGYIRQIGTYALHRGFFAKRYPESSLKLSYFVPSLFVLGLLVGGLLSFFNNLAFLIYMAVLFIYLFLVTIEASKTKSFALFFPFILLVFVTHITYGTGIILGLMKKDLRSKYRK